MRVLWTFHQQDLCSFSPKVSSLKHFFSIQLHLRIIRLLLSYVLFINNCVAVNHTSCLHATAEVIISHRWGLCCWLFNTRETGVSSLLPHGTTASGPSTTIIKRLYFLPGAGWPGNMFSLSCPWELMRSPGGPGMAGRQNFDIIFGTKLMTKEFL